MLREIRAINDAEFQTVSDALISARGQDANEFRIAGQWAATVRALLKRLPSEMIVDAVRIADERIGFKDRDYKSFKYFCGVSWNMVHDVEGTERRRNANPTT